MVGKTKRSHRVQHAEAALHGLLRLLLLMRVVAPLGLCSQEVQFSQPGGFYDESFFLALSYPSGDTSIHYTTNGNAPNANSQVYVSPLHLDQDLYSHSNIYTIRNCPESLWYQPDSVQHCIVIRAAAFDSEGNRISPINTNSYLIRKLGCDTHGAGLYILKIGGKARKFVVSK